VKATIRIRAAQLDVARRVGGLTSNRALAAAMGVHPSTVGRILNGELGIGSDVVAGFLRAFPALTFEQIFEVVDVADSAGDAA
jgi:hypothetical protein